MWLDLMTKETCLYDPLIQLAKNTNNLSSCRENHDNFSVTRQPRLNKWGQASERHGACKRCSWQLPTSTTLTWVSQQDMLHCIKRSWQTAGGWGVLMVASAYRGTLYEAFFMQNALSSFSFSLLGHCFITSIRNFSFLLR